MWTQRGHDFLGQVPTRSFQTHAAQAQLRAATLPDLFLDGVIELEEQHDLVLSHIWQRGRRLAGSWPLQEQAQLLHWRLGTLVLADGAHLRERDLLGGKNLINRVNLQKSSGSWTQRRSFCLLGEEKVPLLRLDQCMNWRHVLLRMFFHVRANNKPRMLLCWSECLPSPLVPPPRE